MESYERIKRTFAHQETDRVPILDSPWAGTIRRWQREGMPQGMDWRDYFDVDKTTNLHIDISPRYESKILEETDEYVIHTTGWGTTLREFKEQDATPQMLGCRVVDADAWLDAKKRMLDFTDRISIPQMLSYYESLRTWGEWIRACFWFGFDVTHSHMMGTETTLIAMAEEPELFCDILDTYLTCNEKLWTILWDAGVHFDELFFYDDMGYKGTAFFSNTMYRELVQPFHTRAVNWAHERGIYAYLHSCGNIMKLLPDIVETGLDALNPLEVKAGMDVFHVKDTYGDKLVLHGGTNAALWHDTEAVLAEIRKTVPYLKRNGGYIFASDHSIPNDVSLDTMRQIIAEVKSLGTF